MHVYQDQELCLLRLGELRFLYPDVDVLVILDGVHAPELEAYCTAARINLHKGRRLKESPQWIVRFLRLFLATSQAEHLIKIDPDTKLLKPLQFLGSGDVFGTMHRQNSWAYINGGAMGFRRSAATKLLQSGILDNPRYCQEAFRYNRWLPPYLATSEQRRLDRVIASDLILSDAARSIGLECADWPEVLCCASHLQLCEKLKSVSLESLSAIHPVKNADNWISQIQPAQVDRFPKGSI